MVKDVLIVGCSFVHALTNINYSRIDQYGSCAASNASIASRVMYQLAQHEYKKVVVIWSGINRLSVPIDVELHKLYQLDRNPYMFYDNQDPMVWYHSGGILAAEVHSNIPKFIKNYFKAQYKTVSSRNLTDQTLQNIIAVQSLLENKKIDYKMNFIYDIHKDYSTFRWGYSLGKIDTSSPLYTAVNWDKITQHNSLHEWAKLHGHLADDQWHITSDGMVKWFYSSLGINLLS
jgi:hypothetical protein